MKLSKNFSLRELTESTTATRLGIDNSPDAHQISNLAELVEHVLQPLRERIGKPIRVSSGFRNVATNRAIGGSSTSDHCHGRAVDVKLMVDGENKSEIIYHTLLAMDIPFKQAIWEFGDEHLDGTPQWVHIAFDKANNKRQKLQAYKDNGKTKYRTI
jgi:hypothetical protein